MAVYAKRAELCILSLRIGFTAYHYGSNCSTFRVHLILLLLVNPQFLIEFRANHDVKNFGHLIWSFVYASGTRSFAQVVDRETQILLCHPSTGSLLLP